jgi:hypothetical protein
MRQAAMRIFLPVALLLLLGIAAEGQLTCAGSACYKRPAADPPTYADLLAYDGQEKTIVVQIVNITPYDIQLKGLSDADLHNTTLAPPLASSSVTATDITNMLNTDRDNRKSFMFAPLGIPRFIPRAPAQAFEPKYLPSPPNPANTPNPNYIEGWTNTETRPYTMVFSWDDHDGMRQDNWVKWTVKGVKYCTQPHEYTVDNKVVWLCDDPPGPNTPSGTRDVDLGLWMYRIANPPTKVESALFPPMLKSTLNEALALMGLALEPENPLDWIHMFQATKELVESVPEFTAHNTEPDAGDKLYLASYAIPHDVSFCTAVIASNLLTCPPTVLYPTPDNPDVQTGDAVYSFWPAQEAGPCTIWGNGVVNVSGTTVTWVSGDLFSSEWKGLKIIFKNATVYGVSSVTTNKSLTLTSSAGTLTNANYTVQGCHSLADGPYAASEAELVVTAHLLRGQPTPKCPSSTDNTTTNYQCKVGRVPMFMVTVMRPEEFVVPTVGGSAQLLGASDTTLTPQLRAIRQFLLQAGAERIRAMLDQQPDRRTGLVVLRSVVEALNLTQRQVARQMVRDMLMGNQPTHEERELVQFVAAQLQAQLMPGRRK